MVVAAEVVVVIVLGVVVVVVVGGGGIVVVVVATTLVVVSRRTHCLGSGSAKKHILKIKSSIMGNFCTLIRKPNGVKGGIVLHVLSWCFLLLVR